MGTNAVWWGSYLYLSDWVPGSHLNPRESGERRRKTKAEGAEREERCTGEINPSLRPKRNLCNYFVLRFIEMYASYLAACKSRITQAESTMKDKQE